MRMWVWAWVGCSSAIDVDRTVGVGGGEHKVDATKPIHGGLNLPDLYIDQRYENAAVFLKT